MHGSVVNSYRRAQYPCSAKLRQTRPNVDFESNLKIGDWARGIMTRESDI